MPRLPDDASVRLPPRVDDGLSDVVHRAVPRVDALANWLTVALVFQLIVHAWGYLDGVYSEGRYHLYLTYAHGVGIDERVQTFGEKQPLGLLEEIAAFLVTTLFVGLLTSAVRQLRAQRAADDLPAQLWRVALTAAIRPRKVVDTIWRAGGSPNGAPGGFLLDILWPAWIVTNLTVRVGDFFSEAAGTLTEAQAATWLEVAAEFGFLVIGVLLLWLTQAVRRRLRDGADARTSVIPVVVAAAVGLPLLLAGAAGAYAVGDYGPSVAQIQAQYDVDALWQKRERAAAASDAATLSRLGTGPVLRGDLAGLDRQWARGRRVRFARELDGATPFESVTALTFGQRDATRMLAVVRTVAAPSWDTAVAAPTLELVSLTRPNPRAGWRLELEVPLMSWPGAVDGRWRHSVPDPRAGSAAAAAAFGGAVGARQVSDLVWMPFREGALICGAAGPHTREEQACVMHDRAGGTTVLGRVGRPASRERVPRPASGYDGGSLRT
ncbi:MAG: hypothetical protein JHC95_14235 [Solirubrobacteraceae bacterium]|nr:hypothetical protein [Solirubrobacteraceae bacterium]